MAVYGGRLNLLNYEKFQKYKGTRGDQSAAEAISQDGIMFFGLMRQVKMACFNIRDQYGSDTIDIIADDSVTLQFPSGVKVRLIYNIVCQTCTVLISCFVSTAPLQV